MSGPKKQSKKIWRLIAKHRFAFGICLLAICVFSSTAIVTLASSPSAQGQLSTEVQLSAPQAFVSETASQQANVTPQFNVQVAYVYVAQRKDHFTSVNPLADKTSVSSLNAASLYPTEVYLNFTLNPNAGTTKPCDAIMEVYLVQLRANTGITESYTYVEGTNYNPTFANLTQLSDHISDFPQTFGTSVRGGFIFNGTFEKTYLGGRAGSYGSYTNEPSSLALWSKGQLETITISVQRIGLIIANGEMTSTIKDSNLQTVAQTTIEKSEESFLFNAVLPSDQMSQINPYEPPLPAN